MRRTARPGMQSRTTMLKRNTHAMYSSHHSATALNLSEELSNRLDTHAMPTRLILSTYLNFMANRARSRLGRSCG